jgi:nitric oxide reductase subunit B
MQRYTDTPLPFMVVQDKIAFFYWMREASGVIFLVGLLVYLVSFFKGRKESNARVGAEGAMA